MPVYEYVCTACGTQVEVIHGVHAAGPATCAACGGAMRKALSVPSIHFKGSGWAKKDARSSGGASTTAKPSGDDAGTTSAVTPAAPAAADAGSGSATPAAGAAASPAAGTTTGGGSTAG